MPIHTIYGIPFTTHLPFPSPLPLSSESPLLTVTEQTRPLALMGGQILVRIAEATWNLAAPNVIVRLDNSDVMVFPDGCQIQVRHDEIAYIHADGPHRPDLMDIRLVGVAFAWWLLRFGRIPLHAGALLLEGELVLFTAESRMGKSSLMCTFLQQGYSLVADDFVALHLDKSNGQVMASSAYPQMRLWPGSVTQFIGEADTLPTVTQHGEKRRVRVGEGWGRFTIGTFPVNRIYVLERREETSGPVEQAQVTGHEAFMTLLTNITMGAIFPLGEFEQLWTIAQAFADGIPIYRLSYPSGWDRLPEVQRTILQPSVAFAPAG